MEIPRIEIPQIQIKEIYIPKTRTSDTSTTETEWKAKMQRNVEHLETIKAYTKTDGSTSIWTSEDVTAIDDAVDGDALKAQWNTSILGTSPYS